MASKIFVVKLKDIIKTTIFTVLGIAIIVVIIAFFNGNKGEYKEGTYSSQIILYSNPVDLLVEIEKGEIKSITLNQLNQTQEVFYPTFSNCIDEITKEVINQQSTDIELNKDYSVTGSIILDAIDNALEQAKK